MNSTSLVGGFNPSEKYESQLGLFFPIYGKIQDALNHQRIPPPLWVPASTAAFYCSAAKSLQPSCSTIPRKTAAPSTAHVRTSVMLATFLGEMCGEPNFGAQLVVLLLETSTVNYLHKTQALVF